MEETNSKWRLCKDKYETIGNLTSVCFIFVDNEYLLIHDKFCKHLLYSMRKALASEITDKW